MPQIAVLQEVTILAETQNVVKMNRPHGMNVGVVIFLIIIIYVVFNIFSYLTSSTVAEYEVGQGMIATNHVYQGLIMRDETIVYAGQSGYVNYYLKNGSRASVNDIVYSIDTTGNLSKQITTAASDGTSLGTAFLSAIADEIDLFFSNYDSNNFSEVYSFKANLDSELSQTLSVNALNGLSDVVDSAEANNTFYKKTSDDTGIILYYTDGYENVTLDNFTADKMNPSGYTKNTLDQQTQVKAGDAVYKRIDSEDWNIVLSISDDLAKQLSEDNYIKIRFCKDDYTVTVPFSITRKDGGYYLILSLQKAMIRYVNDRFVDIELIISEDSGLKIPNSAITSKEFFTIPKEYFTLGGDSSDPGLLIQRQDDKKKDTSVELVTPTIYYETDAYYYIDNESVTAGDHILKSDSTSTYTIGQDVDSLIGVYNINKGYAVFKQINIISQNETYAIVETKTAYGIALYDHIALDGSKVKEDQLITK